jgi:hypothetical protein
MNKETVLEEDNWVIWHPVGAFHLLETNAWRLLFVLCRMHASRCMHVVRMVTSRVCEGGDFYPHLTCFATIVLQRLQAVSNQTHDRILPNARKNSKMSTLRFPLTEDNETHWITNNDD